MHTRAQSVSKQFMQESMHLELIQRKQMKYI